MKYVNYMLISIKSNTEIKLETHLATLHLETLDFIRPVIGYN